MIAHLVTGAAVRDLPYHPADLWHHWPYEPGVVIPLALLAVFYLRGTRRSTAARPPLRRWEELAFATGWLALALALASPLHPLGQVLFSAHMTQHELLMLVAAPLLVLGRPHVALLRAVPVPLVRRVASGRGVRALGHAFAWAANPFWAWLIHAATLWLWHAPVLFQAALRSDAVHALQHASFLGSAALFWWSVLERGTQRMLGYGAAVLYLFTTALHSGLLGVLLTFSDAPWYGQRAALTAGWGMTPLQDQQLGGVIMWAPPCALYTVAGLTLFLGWMRAAGESARRAERAWASGPALEPVEGELAPSGARSAESV